MTTSWRWRKSTAPAPSRAATAQATIRRPASSPCSATTTTICKQKGVPFYKMELPSIIVSYANEGARTKIDELKKVKFSKRSNKAAQGDKSLTVDVDMMIVGGVYQDGVAPV